MSAYEQFLASKALVDHPSGFSDVPELAGALFPFQAHIVAWALRRARAAIFADCGLGKTLMQLEWARHVPGRVLILTPLAVAAQTVAEADRFGIPAVYARTQEEADAHDDAVIIVTNYDRLKAFDPSVFHGVVLDESSILKSYMGATKRALVDAFAETPYRLCCTATPAPNDHVELGNHSEFLGVLSSSLMLSRFFINDTSQAGVYRLKGHAERDFWRWVASWAICIAKPSDLRDTTGASYSDDGFVLPELDVRQHIVGVDHLGSQADTGLLFRCGDLSATELHREMRKTAADRAARTAELVLADSQEPWVLWCNANYEADALLALIPGAVDVRGDMTAAEKESRLNAFSRGETRILVTKPTIAGFGMNWQHCARMAFVGLSYSYEQLYQALRRSWRFGQQRSVIAHVVTAESEGSVLASIREKQAAHLVMQQEMVSAMRDVQGREDDLRAPAAIVSGEPARGAGWELYHGDCVDVARSLPDESVHLSVFSPPFANLYVYTDHPRDMGNTADDAEFFAHFNYLLPELHRITAAGRLAAVHCKNLPMYAGRDGRAGLRDFRGEIIRAFEANGFTYHSEVTIWKCPVTEMQRTKAHGLLYKTLKRDAAFCRQGLADYLVMFRKFPKTDDEWDRVVRVEHTPEDFPLDAWQRYASPVWDDIDPTDVLNVQLARDDQDEKHLCPLQLGVIRRAVHLWTNPGEVVFSPFAGIGSEGVVALELGRQFRGVELKESYFRHAARHLAEASTSHALDLFDSIEVSA